MKIFIRGAAAALALSLVGVSGAEAQLVPWSPACTDWAQALAGYDDCSGAWYGNDSNQQSAVANEIVNNQAWLTGPISTLGGADLAGNATTGTIDFGAVYRDFVLALKAGDSFSLYYFSGAYSSLAYNTVGSGTNRSSTNALSHWNLYGGTQTTVPEPTTLFLLGSGLLAMTGMAWRRRDEILA